ncbi:amino acid permease, partial [Kitasatospora sp. NPDC094028]
RRFARDVTVTVLALAFSYWSIQGSGYQTVYYGLFTVLLGIPVYICLKRPHARPATGALTGTATPLAATARHDEPPAKAARTVRPVGLPTILRRALTPRHLH